MNITYPWGPGLRVSQRWDGFGQAHLLMACWLLMGYLEGLHT